MSAAVKIARNSVGLRPSVRNRLMGDDRGKVLAAFASRADVSDAELTLLVSRSQSVARSVALRDAPLSESALLAVVNTLDDVSPVLSRADLTPRVLAAACERVDADGACRVARRGHVDGAVAAGLARNPWPSVRAIAAKLAGVPADVVDKLAADSDDEVREAVAARADLSRDVARKLWEGSLPGSRTRELLRRTIMEQNNTLPTWKDALRISKELQREYDLPIFAMSFKKSCSCCASPANFNKEAYLDKGVAEKDWADVDAYVVLKNSSNGCGEAQFYRTVKVTEGGKMKSKRVWNEFGTAGGRNDGVQYVTYGLSESFTMDTLRELLTKFVDGLNKAAGFEAYDLVLPDDETECAQIVYA